MFRGSAPAKIDDKGRLKIPTEFRRVLDERWGNDLFLTSVQGDSTLIYPLPVWEGIEEKLARLPSTSATKRKYLERVSYYGQQGTIDAQGRVVIPPILRQAADMSGEVVVSARLDYLEVWNHARLQERFEQSPFTDEDFERLAAADI